MGTTAQGPRRVAVVGGGMLGARLAWLLADGGARVTLYEAGASLGGLVTPWQVGDLTWDRFYHVVLLSDARTRGLIEALGLGDQLRFGTTRTGFYTDGQQYSMSDALEFLRFPPLGLVDKLRLGGTIAAVARLPGGRWLEQIPVLDFLRAFSGARTADRIWRPLLQAKLGDEHARAPAAFIHATIQRMYAARRAGLKEEQFGYVQGGYASVLQALDAALRARGVTVRLDTPVRAVRAGGRVATEHGLQAYDQVVVTTSPRVALKLLGDAPPAAVQRRLEAVEMMGVICASVVLDRPFHGYYVTNITDPSPFTGIIEMSALVDPAQLGGRGLLYLPRYLPAGHPLWDADDAEIERVFLGGLRAMYPQLGPERIQGFAVARAKDVMATPVRGYSARRLPPVDLGVADVRLVTSAQIVNGTLNVDETLGLAERAAPALLEALR